MHRILIALFVAVVARADVPYVLSYTGTLMDESGEVVEDGTYNVSFRLYDVPEGGSALWTEPLTPTTEGGVFTALLGTQAVPLRAEHLAHPQLWLEIEVEGDVLLPRLQVVSVPYAIEAANAEQLRKSKQTRVNAGKAKKKQAEVVHRKAAAKRRKIKKKSSPVRLIVIMLIIVIAAGAAMLGLNFAEGM